MGKTSKAQLAAIRRWAQEHPTAVKRIRQKGYRRMRERLLDTFGAYCEGCGLQDSRCLTLDHIYGGGSRLNSDKEMRKAIATHDTETYRILCHNCQHLARIHQLNAIGRF